MFCREKGVNGLIETKTVFSRQVKVYTERPQTINDMLEKTASKFPNKEAFIDGNVRLSYHEIQNRVETIAANLSKSFQIKKGDRIALLLQNCLEFALLVFASAKLGAIVVPLNTRLREKELEFMLNHSGTKILVTDKVSQHKIELLLRKKNIRQLLYVLVKGANDLQSLGERWFPLRLLEEPSQLDRYPINKEEDPLFIMYTSGTSGIPKGAVGSHIGVIHSAINYNMVMDTNHGAKTLIAVPLFHVTGLIAQLLHMVLIGGTTVVMSRYQTERFIDTIVDEKITLLFNVPTIYVMMLSQDRFYQHHYPFVTTIAYGGAPMSNETIRQLRMYFPNAELHNVYGATETSSPATIMPRQFSDSKMDSVGLPVPGAEIKTIDEQMKECPVNTVGELLIKGAMVIEEYWNNPEANAASFVDGYWKSGDLARIDEDGYVYIMDRKKDMINRGGEKIYSIEVENALYNHSSVLEAAVVGIPDPIFGEQVKAYVVIKEGKHVSAEEIQLFLSEHLADYKIPKEVEFVLELPRNPGGKVLKNYLMKK